VNAIPFLDGALWLPVKIIHLGNVDPSSTATSAMNRFEIIDTNSPLVDAFPIGTTASENHLIVYDSQSGCRWSSFPLRSPLPHITPDPLLTHVNQFLNAPLWLPSFLKLLLSGIREHMVLPIIVITLVSLRWQDAAV
jgi:hypothetical protein